MSRHATVQERTEWLAAGAAAVVATSGELPAVMQALVAERRAIEERGDVEQANTEQLATAKRKLAVLDRHHGAEVDIASQTLALDVWLEQMIARLRPVIPEHVELVARIAADAPAVRCAPMILEHHLLDLVLRACATIPWGGTIWLVAEPDDSDPRSLEADQSSLDSDHVRLNVVDRAAAAASTWPRCAIRECRRSAAA